ncbi:SGNH/GDSL hydrolase family protein [Pedobacter nutrimenti]|jgi:lysophospholipase L1-like esterase|uniref:Lysophospholipase L1-like esterase n=1 Tax=Pedobacter nutrimenti TaxID=1241337 RepID=A0A318UIS5_9SPHI|nr:SGNH/GDSL hydrolase family protein [Pedobacter nutrimenti]PYF76023.1 lysophospholipase L1-like esterase [Pedobacter nutrimenti]
MKSPLVVLSLLVLLACEKPAVQTAGQPVNTGGPAGVKQQRYLALGDSYTIGESVSQGESFPYQLVSTLNVQGLNFSAPVILAKTGWTTAELQSAISSSGNKDVYDMVTLLIGVNNQYRVNSIDTYRKEFRELLQTAIGFAAGRKEHVFVLSIPDWGVTPFGMQSGRGGQNIAIEIDAFNAANKAETVALGVSYTDITPESRTAAANSFLIAADGLHPSGKMYSEWVALLSPAVLKALK